MLSSEPAESLLGSNADTTFADGVRCDQVARRHGQREGRGIFELRAAVWNVSDHTLDSLFLMDDFKWGVDAGEPGTGAEGG